MVWGAAKVGTWGSVLLCVAAARVAAAQGHGEDRGPARTADEKPLNAAEVARLRADAELTLARGQFEKARKKFEEVLKQMPGDALAQRNAARAAQAAGEFEYSAAALEKAHHLEEHKKDPELHYLRGEALYVLKRPDEAGREHRIAELEIGHPLERLPRLWLARIWARRGWLGRADHLYASMWPPSPRFDTEVALNHADAHLMNEDWTGAIAILDRYLERQPKDIRGREMLAWALEATGQLDRELVARAGLAADAPSMSHAWDYGRALERANDYGGAHQQYQSAVDQSDSSVDPALVLSRDHMQFRVSLEAVGGALYRRDPSASSVRTYAGLSVPFGSRHAASALAWYERAWGGYPATTASTGGLAAALILGARYGGVLTLGGALRFTGATPDGTPPSWAPGVKVSAVQAGGTINVQSPILSFAQIDLQGDLNTQWAESPIALMHGGTASGGTGHLFVFPPSRRVVLHTGGQIRRLSLAAADEPGATSPGSTQKLFFIGGDLVLWNDPASVLKGEAMDETLVRRTYLADSAIVTFRHYELYTSSEPEFTARIFLAPRASINNGAAIFRKAFFDGVAGIELRGGIGYDGRREVVLYQAGGSLLLASWAGRLSLSYDFTRETATGFQGNRQIGWLSYHAEF